MSIRPLLEPTGKDNKTLNLYCNSVNTSSIVADELKIDNLEVKDIKCDTLEATSLIQTEDLDASGDIDCENLIAGSISNPPLNSIDFKNTLLYNIDEIYINNNLYTPSILSLTNQVNFNNNSITGANNISGNKIITPLIESDTKQINFNNNTLASINGVFTTSVVSPVLEAIGGNISFNNNNLNDIVNINGEPYPQPYPPQSSVLLLPNDDGSVFNLFPATSGAVDYFFINSAGGSTRTILTIGAPKYNFQLIRVGIINKSGAPNLILKYNDPSANQVDKFPLVNIGFADINLQPVSPASLISYVEYRFVQDYGGAGVSAWISSQIRN